MKAILTTVLKEDKEVQQAGSLYVDDIYVKSSSVSTADVCEHLLKYGLRCESAERVAVGTRVLWFWVLGDGNKLRLKRCNHPPDFLDKPTWRSAFLLCGKLLSLTQVDEWLRLA